MTISTEYEAGKVLDLPYREIIESIVLVALDYGGCPCEAKANVILMDSDAMQEINREHYRVNAPAGILSFPMVDHESPSDFNCMEKAVENYFNPETGELMLEDIVTSVDKMEEQAEKYGHSRIRELASLMAHSILHLFGYDHMEDGERLVMEEKQRGVLETRGYIR